MHDVACEFACAEGCAVTIRANVLNNRHDKTSTCTSTGLNMVRLAHQISLSAIFFAVCQLMFAIFSSSSVDLLQV